MQALAIFILFIIGVFLSALSQKEFEANCKQTIARVGTHIVWDIGTNEDAFDLQRHNVLRFIDSAHEGTYNRLIVFDTKLKNVLDITKDNTSHWMESIAKIKRGTSGQNIIPFESLMASLSNFKKETNTTAIKLLFMVNDETRLDNEEIAIKELEGLIKYVDYKGEKPPPKVWTNLATDRHHLLEVNDNLNGFLNLIIKDSKLYCYTDMYWDGQECKPCTFICSRTPAEDSPYCVQKCPYYIKRGTTSGQSKTSGCNSFMFYTKQQLLIYTIFVLKNYLLR